MNIKWNQIREKEYISENLIYANAIQADLTVFRVSPSELKKNYIHIDRALKGVLAESTEIADDL